MRSCSYAVLDFGAKGDGATDNVKPFQNSLNAAGAGGIGNATIMLASSPGPLRGRERAWYTLSTHAPLPSESKGFGY